MLVYVDLEHPGILDTPERTQAHQLRRLQEKFLFEELSGRPCLLYRYYHFAHTDWLQRLQPAAVLVSGLRSDWEAFEAGTLSALQAAIRAWEGPLIGFCGGHQLIAHAFGAPIGPLRPLEPGEPDPQPNFGPGFYKETGMSRVEVASADGLFDGLPDTVVMYQEHYWEVKALPPEFELLARSIDCPIQAFRHRHLPMFGAQFHPERYDGQHQHGRQLLANFFRLLPSP